MSLPRPRLLTFALSFVLMLCSIATSGFAASAQIGPDHGKSGPRLPAVATPSNIKEEQMVDWSFPAHLAQSQDWPSAVLAYQQLAWQVSGTAKIEALRQVGFAQEQAGNHTAALQTYTNILTLPLVASSPSRTLEFSSKATVAALAAPAASPTTPLSARPYVVHLLTNPSSTNPWSVWALQQVAWQELETTKTLTRTFNLPQLMSLQTEVSAWKQEQSTRQTRTAMLEMLPGLGLLTLGDKRAALGTFALWAFAVIFTVAATRKKDYFAATGWWIILAVIMLSTPTLGAQRALELSSAQWTNQLGTWKQTFANPRPPENPPKQISWIESVPNSALAQEPDYNAILPAAGPTR